jgi:hypothetical protein
MALKVRYDAGVDAVYIRMSELTYWNRKKCSLE